MRSAGQAFKSAGWLLDNFINGASNSGRVIGSQGPQSLNTTAGIECRSLYSQGSAAIIPERSYQIMNPSHLSSLQQPPLYRKAPILTIPTSQSRNFSANAQESAPASDETSPPKKRRKNLIDVVRPMPNWGLGGKVMKSHWEDGSYYELTRVKVNKVRDGGPCFSGN